MNIPAVSPCRVRSRAWFVLLVAACPLALAAATAEVRLPLISSGGMKKMGGYLPQRLVLSADRPAGIKKLPTALSAPLFGTLKLGPADAPTAIFYVLDEPEGKPSRLYVDANVNGDLTDDPAPEWTSRAVKGKDGADYQQYSGVTKVTIPLDGVPSVLTVPVYRFDKHDPMRAAQKDALFYYADYAREGEIKIGDKTYPAVLADQMATGDFRGKADAKSPGVVLMIDLNANGKYESTGERFDVREPFNIGGTTYELAGLTAGGGSFQLAKSSRTVAEKKIVTQRPGLTAGQPATKFKAQTTANVAVDFPASYKGKIVLLDFWATWCGPCIAELPKLIAAYEKYHDRGFDVLGISLDREGDGKKLASFTAGKKMAWPQVFDGKYWKAEIAVLYGVNSIPTAYLVDGDTGLVLAAAGLRGDELDKTIAAALAKKSGK